ASLSMSTSLIDKKIERSLKDISHQQLSKVKYFQFEKDSPEAKLGMPRVVVGTDEDRVRQLLSRWNTKETIKDVEVSFEDDPVWTLMALQINEQLQLFINQAKSHNQTELANVCEKYQRSLEVSLRVNKDLVEKHRILMAQDGTSKAIKSYCEKITKEGLTSKSIHNESEQSRRDDEIFNKAIRA
ncbi:MAG: hypothetical protein IT284_00440, partial [Bacteroidetes bacterium]|nr:hypothetical protein [Bacteroidota bacterium]